MSDTKSPRDVWKLIQDIPMALLVTNDGGLKRVLATIAA